MSGGLADAERDSLLVPCGCGHTINDHGGLTGCWTCADDGGDCGRSFEALLAERLDQIIAARVAAALNDAADELLMFDPSDNYHDADQRKSPYYAAIDRAVSLLRGEISCWTDPPPT